MYVSTQLSSHSQHRAIHRKREYFNQLESFAVINFSGCIDLHWSLRLTFWSSWLGWVRSDWWAETDWVLQLKLLNFYPWPGLAPRSQSCSVLLCPVSQSDKFCAILSPGGSSDQDFGAAEKPASVSFPQVGTKLGEKRNLTLSELYNSLSQPQCSVLAHVPPWHTYYRLNVMVIPVKRCGKKMIKKQQEYCGNGWVTYGLGLNKSRNKIFFFEQPFTRVLPASMRVWYDRDYLSWWSDNKPDTAGCTVSVWVS